MGIIIAVIVGFIFGWVSRPFFTNKSERKSNNTSSGGGTDTTSNNDVNVN